MGLSAQEITTQFLMLPEQEKQKVIDFVLSLQSNIPKKTLGSRNGGSALLSELALATDWNRVEEDEAWEKFQ